MIQEVLERIESRSTKQESRGGIGAGIEWFILRGDRARVLPGQGGGVKETAPTVSMRSL